MTVSEINSGLKIKKLNGERFRSRFGGGTYVPVGYCLHHDKLGYLGFEDTPHTPYIPCYGQRALEIFMEEGGISSAMHIVWIKPV